MSKIESVNPATGETIAAYEPHSSASVDARVEAAARAAAVWRTASLQERGELVRAIGSRLRRDRPRLARLITLEMGKPIAEAEAEIDKSAWNCDFYAEHAAKFLAEESVESSAQYSAVRYEPLGVVLAVMPWNFPFWQVVRFLAPALMAGNATLLKHASNVPQCALAIEEVVRSTGSPEGLFSTVLIPASDVEGLVGDPRIAAITLTGSSAAGSRVAAAAGRHLKKQVLELGGSDPFVVLRDADLDLAVAAAVRARNQNSGQSCIAAKRFIVEATIADEFTAGVADQVRSLKVGDPFDRDTDIGPLARADLRETLATQVEKSLAAGAREVARAPVPESSGFFFPPLVVTAVKSEMPIFSEETFGPVATIMDVPDAETAVAVANATEYGLGASLWTEDLDLGRRLAQRIEAGAVFVNGIVASDPRLPFGGVKRSGYGRELGSFGIREFTNIKTLWVGPVRDASARGAAE